MAGMDGSAIGWLQTPAAVVAARRALERQRLPANLADDALQEARVRVWRQEQSPDMPEAVARRAIQQAVADLHRKAWRRVVEEKVDDAADPVQPDRHAHLPGALEDLCRRVVNGRLARRPWVAAAVLNEITFRVHRDVPIPEEAPAPDAASDEEPLSWAALWLAGRFECFPPEGSDDAAAGQRRSRSLSATARELRLVVASAVEQQRS